MFTTLSSCTVLVVKDAVDHFEQTDKRGVSLTEHLIMLACRALRGVWGASV